MRGPRSATAACEVRTASPSTKPDRAARVPTLPSDPVARARALHEVYDAVLSGATRLRVPRSLVSESWRRSLAARVDPDRHVPPVSYRAADLDGVRAAHPLGAVLPLLRSTLVSIADEAVHVMVVTDADGTILWREGARSLLRSAADSVGLAPGMRWSEEAIGTNAMGTALAVDAPVSDPLRRAPGAHRPRLDLRRRPRARPRHRHADRRDRHQRAPAHRAPGDGAARGGHGAAGGEPAAGAPGDRGRAAADPQHAAPGEPARPAGRAGHTDRADPGGRAVQGVAGARAIAPGTDRVRLDDGREMAVEPLAEGYLLHAAHRPPPGPAPGAVAAVPRRHTRRCCSTARPSRSRCGPPSCSPRWRCTRTGSRPNASRCCSTATTATRRPCAARCCACAALIGSDVLRTRPYRLDATVDTDFGTVRPRPRRPASPPRRSGRAPARCCPARTPRRSARSATRWCVGLRRAVLAADETDLLADYARHPLGRDDLEVHDRLLDRMGPHDRRRPPFAAHHDRLLAADA